MESHPPGFSSGRASLCLASEPSRALRASARALPLQVCRVTSHPPRKSTYHSSLFSSAPSSFWAVFHFVLSTFVFSGPAALICALPVVFAPFPEKFVPFLGVLVGARCRWPPRSPFPALLLHPPNLHILALPLGAAAKPHFLRPASIPQTVHAFFPLLRAHPSRLNPEFLGTGPHLHAADGTHLQRCSVPTQPMSPPSQ